MTVTDLCVNKPHLSRSYLTHLVHCADLCCCSPALEFPPLRDNGSTLYIKECKGKVNPRTSHEVPEGEQRYSSTLFLTSTLGGEGGQRHAPAAFPPRKTRYPLYRRLGGLQGRSGRVRKISPPTGVRSTDHPAPCESLYRLRHHGESTLCINSFKVNGYYLYHQILAECICVPYSSENRHQSFPQPGLRYTYSLISVLKELPP